MENIFVEFLPPWVETGLQPAFYDKESGTVLQQTARMYARVNMLIRMFNKLSKNTKEEIERFETSINETVENYIEQFNQLHDYVHDYFDNLDVQEEINNKLDQMLEDGVLQEIISQFLQSTAIWCFDSVADLKTATNLIEGSYARTLGYYTANDGGGATYKIKSEAPSGYYENLNSGLYAELIIEPNVNVNQFGAKGDGSTDDTQAISEALNRVDTIDFLNSTYIINDLETVHDITIHGNGATLKWENDSNGVIEINHNVKIDNINFDKNNASNYVLYKAEDTEDNLVDVELSECSFSNSASGVVPLYLVHLNKLDINECTFSNLLSSSMNAGSIKFVNITNNLFNNIGNLASTNRSGNAIYIGHSQYISILNNTIVNCTDSAIYCSNSYAEFVNISNNKINNSQKEGIKNQGAGRKTIIEGNILKDIYSNAIIVSSRQEECIVSNNIVEGSCIDGGVTSSSKVGAIAISYANRNVIVNNNIVKMTSLPDIAGVYVYNSTGIDHVNIMGNLIDGTSGPAISATSCEFINVSSNICMNNCIKSTIAKIPVNLGSCTGTFNNNSISQPDILSISCTKIDNTNIRIPLGVCDCFSQSQNVTVYYVDDNGNKVSQSTTISAVDFANRTITLTDQLPSGNPVDEYYLEIDVSSVHLVNPMRLTGTSHIVAIGNHIRSIYGYNPNIASSSTMLPVLADFYTLNIREAS